MFETRLGGEVRSDPDVNAAVKNAVEAGSMATLNCPEEVQLAELLCELHPWAQCVRFTRCGGEAMAVAARIARATTDRSLISHRCSPPS